MRKRSRTSINGNLVSQRGHCSTRFCRTDIACAQVQHPIPTYSRRQRALCPFFVHNLQPIAGDSIAGTDVYQEKNSTRLLRRFVSPSGQCPNEGPLESQSHARPPHAVVFRIKKENVLLMLWATRYPPQTNLEVRRLLISVRVSALFQRSCGALSPK